MNGTVNTKSVALALGLSPKTVLKRAKEEGCACVQKPGGILWAEKSLPLDVRLALENSGGSGNGAVTGAGNFNLATEKERQAAVMRSGLIMEFRISGLRKEEFIAAYNSRTGARLYKTLGRCRSALFTAGRKNSAARGWTG
ncbi:MAG: hypothetical protein LBH43_04385 [Treponema sp.]|jgi:hypothetical protein|nr:hypothetical protein [Treponema sp.]